MQATSITRAEQAAVLFILMDAHGEPLSPERIARRINSRFAPRVPANRVGIECALACIALRPHLRRRLRIHTRPTTRVERQRRAHLGIPMLLSATIVAACSVQPLTPPRYAQGYFGSPTPVARTAQHRAPPAQRISRPAPDSPWVLPSGETSPATYAAVGTAAPKIPARLAQDQTPSYFDDAPLHTARWAQPRPEAALATQADAAHAVATVAPEATLAIALPAAALELTLPAAQDHPVHGLAALPIDLRDELAHFTRDTDSLAALLVAQGQSLHEVAQALDRAVGPAPAPVAAAALAAATSPDALAWTQVAALPPIDHDGQYWIGFRNGSQRLLPEGAVALKALAEHLPERAEIQLRGRVGFRSPTGRQVELAVGRALAVKAQLVAAGVPAEAIRIQFPQANDWLDGSRADAPANMSVSVYLDDASKKQIASRLQPKFVADAALR